MRAPAQAAGFDRIGRQRDEGFEIVLRRTRKPVPLDDALDGRRAAHIGDRLKDQYQRDRRDDDHELGEDAQFQQS